ncbi:MAG: zinc ribbon domain-containing protein [Planctomycetota bacterium]
MPFYNYEHTGETCKLGKEFTIMQSINEPPLTKCPECGKEIKRLFSNIQISVKKSNRELKNLGFKKYVRRDKGIYEDVTADTKENKIVDASKIKIPENMD